MNFLGLGAYRRPIIIFCCANLLSACSAISLKEMPATVTAPPELQLQTADRSIAERERQSALESAVSGKPVYWKNPASGASGSITPLKTWKTAEGTYCRSYSEKFTLSSGKSMDRRGVACRSSNAVWEAA